MMGLTLLYSIPEPLRPDFASPRGLVISGDFSKLIEKSNWAKVVCLGDVVSEYCLRSARLPDLVVVDLKTRRRDMAANPAEAKRRFEMMNYVVVTVANPQGGLSADAAETLCSSLQSDRRTAMIVAGEEDMLTLAALQCAPPGSLVIYGIPMKGAALVVVDRLLSREAQTRQLRLRPIPFTT